MSRESELAALVRQLPALGSLDGASAACSTAACGHQRPAGVRRGSDRPG